VQETADGIEALRAAKLPVGGVIVNLVRPRDLDAAQLKDIVKDDVDRETLAKELSSVGIDVDDELVEGLLIEARDHAERRALEDSQRMLVAEMDVPSYELPRLPGGADIGGLYELAALLRDQGLG
jgi:hypothetical protein